MIAISKIKRKTVSIKKLSFLLVKYYLFEYEEIH